jgi:hypothetical protein
VPVQPEGTFAGSFLFLGKIKNQEPAGTLLWLPHLLAGRFRFHT